MHVDKVDHVSTIDRVAEPSTKASTGSMTSPTKFTCDRERGMTITNAGNSGLVLEMAVLNVRPGEEITFERAIRKARPLIAATPGFVAIEIRRCVETTSRYLLLVT